MVAGRALQGLAAGVIPLGISIMRDELPSERLGSAIAMMSASLGVGGALGLPLAGISILGALTALTIMLFLGEGDTAHPSDRPDGGGDGALFHHGHERGERDQRWQPGRHSGDIR